MVGNRIAACVAAVAMLLGFAQAPAFADGLEDQIRDIVKDEMGKKNGLRAYWKNGLRLDSADGDIKLKMGGRIMIDWSIYDDDDFKALGLSQNGNTEDGFEFRRARVYTSGLIYDNVKYKFQIEFGEPNDPQFKDMYIGLTNLGDCLGCAFPDVTVGHYKNPMGLEWLTSSKYITFMERSAPVNAFAAGRKTGIMLSDSLMGDTFTWAASFHSPTSSDDNPNGDFDDGWAATLRATWLPWYDCDCECKLFHIGGAVRIEEDLKGRRVRARPPTHLTTRFVNTGTIADVESTLTWNVEAALVYGPWSIQGEYYNMTLDSVTADDPTFSGWYAQASYWLTGECRKYKKGAFSRVKPCCNFLDNDCCCTGAWEIGARYEFIDLIAGNIDGGEQSALTVGVNWHLNPNTRVMFNYFLATLDGTPAGFNGGATTFDETDLSGFQMRFQVDF